MADPEQLRILKQGYKTWNEWREQHLTIPIDLSGADLRAADLRGVNLHEANLSRANLRVANLRGADLSEADLSWADLNGTNLSRVNLRAANLSEADLRSAKLTWSDLSEANFTRADLTWSDFGGANLSGANLLGAVVNGATGLRERPDLAKDTGKVLQESIQRLGAADIKDVLQIGASQLELLTAYHQVALKQSNRAFSWALTGSAIGLLLFVVAVGFALGGLSLASIVPLIAGAVVNVISGIVFVLYGKASSQLSSFYNRLEVLQRYLIANSICESLTEAQKDKSRAELIGEISRSPRTDTQPSIVPRRRRRQGQFQPDSEK